MAVSGRTARRRLTVLHCTVIYNHSPWWKPAADNMKIAFIGDGNMARASGQGVQHVLGVGAGNETAAL